MDSMLHEVMTELGDHLGRFDLQGQINGLEHCREHCVSKLKLLSDNKEKRLRSYQTLGLCAGAAIAILLVQNMEIDLIFKIAAIGIIVSILNQVLSKSGREEQATMTTLTGLVVVLMIVAEKIAELFDLMKVLFGL